MLLRVDKPLKRRVQEAVLRRTRQRNYHQCGNVPTEAELEQLFGVGHSRLREAIGNLVEQEIKKFMARDISKTAPHRFREWVGEVDYCHR